MEKEFDGRKHVNEDYYKKFIWKIPKTTQNFLLERFI